MHVAITGASSGIGAAIAREYAAAGANLTLVARRRDRLEALADELSAVRTHIVVHDLSDNEGAAAWIDGAVETLGPIDVLVNNAGVQVIAKTDRVEVERGEHSLRVNLLSPLRLMRAVLPSMIERRSGTIVNVASVASLAPTPFMTYYNASKGGLSAASESLRGELRGTGVNVVTVYPGAIGETDMGRTGIDTYAHSAAVNVQPQGTAKGLAQRVRKTVARRRARLIYPRVNAVTRHLPNATRWFLDRFTPALRDEAASATSEPDASRAA